MLQQKLNCLLVQISAMLLFLCAVKTVLKDLPKFKYAINQLCLEGHSNFLLIIQSVFNCFAKNKFSRLKAFKAEICEKCSNNRSNENNFVIIICKCKSEFCSKIHEALLIKKLSPKLNRQMFANGALYVFIEYILIVIFFLFFFNDIII